MDTKPLDLDSKPQGLDNKPLDLDSKSLDLDNKPLDLDSAPLDLDNKPPDLDSTPLGGALWKKAGSSRMEVFCAHEGELVAMNAKLVDVWLEPVGGALRKRQENFK